MTRGVSVTNSQIAHQSFYSELLRDGFKISLIIPVIGQTDRMWLLVEQVTIIFR